MNLVTTIIADKEEFEKVQIALSIVQELEHMYDGVNTEIMDALGTTYDVLADIIFERR